jgi:hypothetical protein
LHSQRTSAFSHLLPQIHDPDQLLHIGADHLSRFSLHRMTRSDMPERKTSPKWALGLVKLLCPSTQHQA